MKVPLHQRRRSRPVPVLPLVSSTTGWPNEHPSAMASSMICRAMRSDPPGLR
jgi:hypothetical protein